jgi:hypothetical protein
MQASIFLAPRVLLVLLDPIALAQSARQPTRVLLAPGLRVVRRRLRRLRAQRVVLVTVLQREAQQQRRTNALWVTTARRFQEALHRLHALLVIFAPLEQVQLMLTHAP